MIGLVKEHIKVAALFRMDNRVVFWTISVKVLEEDLPEFGLLAEQASPKLVKR
jgi:hypothetical protein